MPRSRTQFAILALLRLQPMSGYEIREFCLTRLRHFWNESFGQIYPTLARLTEEGSIRRIQRTDKPRSVSFELTASGKERLRYWLAEAPSPRTVRDEVLLKLFCGREAGPGVLLRHLAEVREHASRQIDVIGAASGELESLVDHPDHPYWRLMLRSGELAFQARLEWCSEAEQLLSTLAEEGKGSSDE